MSRRPAAPGTGPWRSERLSHRLAVNMTSRYLAVAINLAAGVVMLPFNLAYLGKSDYGLWMLTASITTYFGVMELGYGGGLVKFVAQYRAWRDRDALNEIASTIFVVFAGIALVTYAGIIVAAMNVHRIFNLTPDEIAAARWLLLILGVQVASYLAFSVFGGVINGFQRYDLNSGVSIVASLTTTAVNVAVLLAGYGLVELVAAVTSVRVAAFFVYRRIAYRVFPGLRIRWSSFSRQRLREVTGFSVWVAVINWGRRLNFASDPIVIGMFLGSPAVATWTVGQRLAQAVQRVTNQLNRVLFPAVVDSDASQQDDRLRLILVQGTRLSLAMVVPAAVTLVMLAEPVIEAWVGPGFETSVVVAQLLALAVLLRVGDAAATTLLKGSGAHRLLAGIQITTGVVNIALSILLVRWIGLPGIAIGTLVPVGAGAVFVIFPRACRRVGLSWRAGLASAVWPALWPGLVVAALLAVTRTLAPATVVAIAAQIALAGLTYLAVFYAVAIRQDERRLYRAKAVELLKWRPGLEVAA